MERQNISESRAIQKISVQMPLEWKCERAHYVVENSGTLKDTTQQVVRIIETLNASKHHWKVRIILALLSSGIFTLLLWVGIKLIDRNCCLSWRSYFRIPFVSHLVVYLRVSKLIKFNIIPTIYSCTETIVFFSESNKLNIT